MAEAGERGAGDVRLSDGRGANVARGSASKRDLKSMDTVLSCREELVSLFGGWDDDPRYATFTANVTESINVVLKGFLKPGMTVLTSSMEHNAVLRPCAGWRRGA